MDNKFRWVLKHNKNNSYYKLKISQNGACLFQSTTENLKDATIFDDYLSACDSAKFNPAFTLVSYANEL